ncbi:MAG: hypothetical protein ACE5Q6_03510 [Dehalococcoidia bacterium]
MPALALTRATNWAEVEAAAAIPQTCIQTEGRNWEKAKETWDLHSGGDPAVIYFTVHIPYKASSQQGYIRLLKANTSQVIAPTWVVDFVRPVLYGIVVMAAAEVPGSVLVKKFSADDDAFVDSWPTVTFAVPRLDEYPYHAQSSTEAVWLVVPKAG